MEIAFFHTKALAFKPRTKLLFGQVSARLEEGPGRVHPFYVAVISGVGARMRIPVGYAWHGTPSAEAQHCGSKEKQ